MASEQTVLNMMGRALWDPKPTATDLQARQLAVALGYPRNWRVVRSILDDDDDDGEQVSPAAAVVVVDRIYSAEPGSGCDMWLNHAAAQEAAATWETETEQTPFAYAGGHLLKVQPLFDKGDKVQVLYEGEYWDARIVKRKEYPGEYKYQVFYPVDASKQSGVEEKLIRHTPTDVDPEVRASHMGFGEEGWKAYPMPGSRWKIVAPDGKIYKTKKEALAAYQAGLEAAADEGDPPWRTSDHEYLGRQVLWTTQYRVSARRTVDLEQVGTITGWISETDVDKEGEPGFVSEKTGQPAPLFHVKFPEDKNHLYAAQLLMEQDLEEYEVLECLLPDASAEPPTKKARTMA